MSAEEAIMDVVENTTDILEKGPSLVSRIVRNHALHVGVALSLGFVGGVAASRALIKSKLQTAYEEISRDEIEAAKEYYQGLYRVREYDEAKASSSPEDLLLERHGEAVETPAPAEESLMSTAVSAHQQYLGQENFVEKPPANLGSITGRASEAVDTDAETDSASSPERPEHPLMDPALQQTSPEPVHIFDGADPVAPEDDGWDYNEEIMKRAEDPTKPYIVHHDEYYENDMDHTQVQLTYYAGDDVLTDEHEVVIIDTDPLVGDEALVRFGHGSKDKNTVFVRNERTEADYEIVRSPGSYQHEVLNMDDTDSELRHNGRRSGMRFRNHWDD